MASNNNLTDVFNDIATAINSKGVAGTMTPVEMADKIAEIPTSGGGNLTNISLYKETVSNSMKDIFINDTDSIRFTSQYIYGLPCRNGTKISFSLYSAQNSFRLLTKFKTTTNITADTYQCLFSPEYSSYYPYVFLSNNNNVNKVNFGVKSTNDSTDVEHTNIFSFNSNTWYYILICWQESTKVLSCKLYDENGTLVQHYDVSNFNQYTNDNPCDLFIGGRSVGSYITSCRNILIDIQQTFFEVDGVIQWGNINNKTINMGWEASE